MSVLIKGMEMPQDGAFVEVLIWSDGHVTKTGDSYLSEDGKHYYKPCDWEHFSAIPIPPHGRLIDADAAAKQGWTISRTYSASPTEMVYEVKTMTDEVLPTIIPADKDGKT